MASYSNAPSVTAGVSATTTTSNVAVYTAPASSYAIVNAQLVPTAAGWKILINGQDVYTAPSAGSYTMTLYVGPSQDIKMLTGGAGTCAFFVTGVQFTNAS